ncbi:MAG: Hpt domain-containing protein [Rhodobiaceae bacterium]|nr:Hpt domain-containing protein [Rhodobiaceae bacterium]
MADANTTDSRADRLAQAEAAINALKGEYAQQLRADADHLSRVFASVNAENPEADALEELFGIAHNLKGQAGSFGYDLVTSIAASLCDLLRGQSGSTSPRDLKVIGQHVQVMERVVNKGIVGDGGETGQKIVQSLRDLHPHS